MSAVRLRSAGGCLWGDRLQARDGSRGELNRPDRTHQLYSADARRWPTRWGPRRRARLVLTGGARRRAGSQRRAWRWGGGPDLGESVEQVQPADPHGDLAPMPVIARWAACRRCRREHRFTCDYDREGAKFIRVSTAIGLIPTAAGRLGCCAAGRPARRSGWRPASRWRPSARRCGADLEGSARTSSWPKVDAPRPLRGGPREQRGSKRCPARAGARSRTPSSTARRELRCASWVLATIIARRRRLHGKAQASFTGQ
jgi:hypothetical protein